MTRPAPRERLIDATIASLRRHGVHGTGIAEVLSTSGTARQSIYQHFPGGKSDLVAAATRRAGDVVAALPAADAHAHVDARADWWIRQFERHDYALGCPVAAAALAGSDLPDVVAAAADVFAMWVTAFADLLVAEGAEREAAQALARFQIGSIEGAIMTSRALRSTQPMQDHRAQLHRLVDGVLPH